MNRIHDLDEVQFRQVHPDFVLKGLPSRKAFMPKKEHGWKLSMCRSASTSAKDFFHSYTKMGLKSFGVYGVTPRELAEEPNPIECFSSPSRRNPNHSHADFSGLSSKQIKLKADDMCEKAISRGRLHP